MKRNPRSRTRTPEKLLQHLLEHVYVDGDCRIWAGQVCGSGYPSVMVERRKKSARRVLLQLLGKRLTRNDFVVATCGVRTCMAPEHLRIESRAEHAARQRRMSGVEKSRQNILARARAGAKLPVTELPSILRMRAEGRTMDEIAAHYGVWRGQLVRSMRAWRKAGFTGWIPSKHGEKDEPRRESPVLPPARVQGITG